MNSIGCLTESMVVGDGIIKKVDVVDVSPDTYPRNIRPARTGWLDKVENCNNGSTSMSVKLYVDGLLYHNILL